MVYISNKGYEKLLDFLHGGRRQRKRYENKIRKNKESIDTLANKNCDNRR